MQSIFSLSALPGAEALPGAGSDGGHVLTQEAMAQGHVWLLHFCSGAGNGMLFSLVLHPTVVIAEWVFSLLEEECLVCFIMTVSRFSWDDFALVSPIGPHLGSAGCLLHVAAATASQQVRESSSCVHLVNPGKVLPARNGLPDLPDCL